MNGYVATREAQTVRDGPIIVVGSGPAGMRFVEEYYAREPQGEVLLFGGEPWAPYDRVMLSAFLAGDVDEEEIFRPASVPDGVPLRIHHNTPIVAIDPAARQVVDAAGGHHGYRKLVLAVGSRPHVPNIRGADLSGVYTFRDMDDAQRLMARTARSHRTLVLGGGLLGLEAARALQRGGTQVTVIDHGVRLMARQLDGQAADLLKEQVYRLGIQVVLGDGVAQLLGEERFAGVRLRSGRELLADTLVVATGIRANTELATAAGLAVGDGIKVDDQLRTSHPDIYAIGECAEHRGTVYGIVAPALEQAAVAAHHIHGADAQYRGSSLATSLKVMGFPVQAAGRSSDDDHQPGDSRVMYRSADGERYRCLVLQRERLAGAVGIGTWEEWPRLAEAVARGARVWPWQVRRFARSGSLARPGGGEVVTRWPVAAVVCACKGVNRGTLSDAVDAGCPSPVELSERTGAGTVCGSCRPLLAQFYGVAALAQATRGYRWLAAGSLLAVLLLVIMWLFPAVPYAGSFAVTPRWDLLWRDGVIKQITGFTILGTAILGLMLSLRKRIPWLSFGTFSSWRLVHTLLGVVALLALMLHTGLRFGSNLNAWLMANFLFLTLLGTVAGIVTAFEHRISAGTGKALRAQVTWLHILLVWPLPVLLGFHIAKTYYF